MQNLWNWPTHFIDNMLFTTVVNREMRVNKRNHRLLQDVLSDLPGLVFTLTEGKKGASDKLQLQVATTGKEKARYRLSVVWAGSGWPSEVRRELAKVERPWPRNLVVAARSFSPGSLEELHRYDANWLDAAGNVRLSTPPGLVVLRVAPEGKSTIRSDFSWSTSSVSIAEHLLVETIGVRGVDRITLKELAGETGWSAPQVSNVLRAFDEREWTARRGPPRGRGVWRELTNPGTLLEAWSAYLAVIRPMRIAGHKLTRDPIRFLREELAPRLDEIGIWAITGWAGLEIVAPYVSTVPSLQVYLPTERFQPRIVDALFSEMRIRKVDEGGNIEIWESVTSLLVAGHAGTDVPVVNFPRLYSDLLEIGGRAREGAEHLRETRIGY